METLLRQIAGLPESAKPAPHFNFIAESELKDYINFGDPEADQRCLELAKRMNYLILVNITGKLKG